MRVPWLPKLGICKDCLPSLLPRQICLIVTSAGGNGTDDKLETIEYSLLLSLDQSSMPLLPSSTSAEHNERELARKKMSTRDANSWHLIGQLSSPIPGRLPEAFKHTFGCRWM